MSRMGLTPRSSAVRSHVSASCNASAHAAEISAACADALQEAETWLRTALDLGVSPILDMSSLPMQSCSVKMSAQINLA